MYPPQLGGSIGVSRHIGKIISYWILAYSGIPISCGTVQGITNIKKQTD